MGIRLPSVILSAKKISKNHSNVPKGHMAVYVGETQKKRFVVPVSYLFQALLRGAEEEFGVFIIQWVVSQFHAKKMPLLISLPT